MHLCVMEVPHSEDLSVAANLNFKYICHIIIASYMGGRSIYEYTIYFLSHQW